VFVIGEEEYVVYEGVELGCGFVEFGWMFFVFSFCWVDVWYLLIVVYV